MTNASPLTIDVGTWALKIGHPAGQPTEVVVGEGPDELARALEQIQVGDWEYVRIIVHKTERGRAGSEDTEPAPGSRERAADGSVIE